MKKKLIALAITSAFAGSGTAMAASDKMMPSASVNGFIDTTYALTDDFAEDEGFDADGAAANSNEGDFHNEGEIDVHGKVGDNLYARIDLDVSSSASTTTEQLFGAWKVTDAVKLKIGKFNHGIGYEGHDAPDISTITHSLLWNALDYQTSGGQDNINSVEGAAVGFDAGPAKVTLGLVNDLQGQDDATSFLGKVSGSMQGLDLELSVLTQEDNTTVANGNPNSFEGLTNFNVAYGMDMWKVWFDYLSAGAVVDAAYTLGGMFDFGNGVSVTARFDTLEWENSALEDNEAMTLAASWYAEDNLEFLAEWRSDEFNATGNNLQQNIVGLDGITGAANTNDGDRFMLESIFTF